MAEFVNITGLDAAVRALKLLPRELSGDRGGPVRAGLFAAGALLKKQAIANAPVGNGTPNPGNLRKQMMLYRDKNPGGIGAAEHYILTVRSGRRGLFSFRVGGSTRALTGRDAYYWWYVEVGTSKQPAQNFMRNAFEAEKMQAISVFKRVFIAGIDAAEERARIASGGK